MARHRVIIITVDVFRKFLVQLLYMKNAGAYQRVKKSS